MAQSLVLSSLPGEHPLFAELGDLTTEKTNGGQAYTSKGTGKGQHRAGLHSRDTRVEIRCNGELSMCGVAFPPL